MTEPDLIIIQPATPVRVLPEDLEVLAADLRRVVPSASVRVSLFEAKEWTPPSGETVWLWVGRGADVLQYASALLIPAIVRWLRARFRDPHSPPGAKMVTLYKTDGTVLTSVRLANESAEPEDCTDEMRRSGLRRRPPV